MASIAYQDPELEESFSFSSCYDFNSSLPSIFSDDDESDDESYIEIALEPTDHTNDYDEEMELRISFSSSVSHSITKPKTRKHDEFVVTTSVPSSPSTFTMGSSSSATENDQWESQIGSKTTNKASTCGVQKTTKRRVQFSTVNRFIDILKPGLRASSEVDDENSRPANDDHLVLVRSSTRNATTTTTTTNNGISDQKMDNGIMMKFLIKFRALKIRTLVASFMKSCQVMNSLDKRNLGTYQRLMKKPLDKLLLQKEPADQRPRVLEMNLDAVRGVLEAVSSSLGRKDRKCEGSCPTSTKSSPMHDGYDQTYKMRATTDNSIQAAIAHCKRSFGPNVA